MKPATAQFIDKAGSYWRICKTTRHYEKCVNGVWVQDDSADELYPLDEAAPNGYSHSETVEYRAV